MGKSSFWKMIGIGAGVALGVYLTREYTQKKRAYLGNYSPLIDHVNITTDGVLTERWLFFWDDEERCSRTSQLRLDSMGNVTSRKHLVFDFQEDRVEVLTYLDDEDTPDDVSYLLLNELDVVTSIIHRAKGGQEERWDTSINGAELSQIISEDSTAKMYWHEGNLEGVSYDGEARVKMTYYKNKENHIFPDINLFINGFDIKMLLTYMMGTRSRHFLRSKVTSGANYHQQSHISYLLDSFDRPIQVFIEETELSNEISINSTREFDIAYKKI